MATKVNVEGLLIHKRPYQERNLLAKILLRDGNCLSVIFYGGRGGGTKAKGSDLEIGHMLELEFKRVYLDKDLQSCSEWKTIWSHQKIRYDFQKYSLLCFYCELANLVSPESDLDFERDNTEFEGVFRVVSNALFALENQAGISTNNSIFVFLGKLLHELGVFPHINSCSTCGESFEKGELRGDCGGFVCSQCDSEVSDEVGLRDHLRTLKGTAYKDLSQLNAISDEEIQTLLQYFLFQFQLSPLQLKTFEMIQLSSYS